MDDLGIWRSNLVLGARVTDDVVRIASQVVDEYARTSLAAADRAASACGCATCCKRAKILHRADDAAGSPAQDT